MQLITFGQYTARAGISERHLYRMIAKGRVFSVKKNGETYIIDNKPEITRDPKTHRMLVDSKKRELKERIKQIAIGGADLRTEGIKGILDEIEKLKALGLEIKGFGLRNIQRMLKKIGEAGTGAIERKTRSDKFKPRIKLLAENPEILDKAIELVGTLYLQDPLKSLANALDRVRLKAEKEEDLWELRAVNYYTLKYHIRNAFRQSGMATLSEYFNHYNLFRKKFAYVKGAFTDDIGFFDVFAADDRKLDVMGAQVWNEETGEFEQKMLFSWSVIDIHSMYILGWKIQARAFTEDDIMKLLVQVFKNYGLPKKKIIFDNGLMSSARCMEFFNKVGVAAEAQTAYSPTDKAPIERIHRMMKEECDIYNENFVGSDHHREGRHRGVVLSPEQTTALYEEEIKRYEGYFSGYYLDRPRKLELKGIEHLLDNTKRCSLRQVFEYHWQTHEKIEVSDRVLRYAYMQKHVTSFENFFIRFKKEVYLPTEDLPISLNDPTYQFTICYNPNDLNEIDLYSNQDIIDKFSGLFIAKGDYVCTLSSLAQLDADEKRKKVSVYNKSIKKKMLELANAVRSKMAFDKNLVNVTADEAGVLTSIRKEQEKEIARIITEALPMEKIEVIAEQSGTAIDTEQALSEEAISTLDNIKID